MGIRLERLTLAVAGIAWLAAPSHAIDKCRAKTSGKTGVIEVSAKDVSGPLFWGDGAGQETEVFFNEVACVTGSKAKKCLLGDPATVAAKTPPPSCSVFVTDGATSCSAYIRGCTPGVREASLRILPSGVATTLAPSECAFVFVFGAGLDSEANQVIAFHIVDENDQRIASLDNQTAFEPGTVFLTSQGGTIAHGRVCNLSAVPKILPEGWKAVVRML